MHNLKQPQLKKPAQLKKKKKKKTSNKIQNQITLN